MTDHEYDSYGNTPVLEAQPLNLTQSEKGDIAALVSSMNFEVRAAHLYDRKGYATTDDFAGHQNPSYRSDRDDIVVQVTVRVRPERREEYAMLTHLHRRTQAERHAAEVAAREAEVAKAEADLAAAQARLDTLRATS